MHQKIKKAALESERTQSDPSAAYAESATVLLVDDDLLVRSLVLDTLKDAGYLVLEADGPDEALRQCERHRGPIHLLLTDVRMPEMNGCRLAEVVKAARKETKVLLMTGHADEALLRYGVKTLGAVCIRKPFLPDSLLNTVQTVLGIGVTAASTQA
nr:response regulator [Nitrospirota bacterium]